MFPVWELNRDSSRSGLSSRAQADGLDHLRILWKDYIELEYSPSTRGCVPTLDYVLVKTERSPHLWGGLFYRSSCLDHCWFSASKRSLDGQWEGNLLSPAS